MFEVSKFHAVSWFCNLRSNRLYCFLVGQTPNKESKMAGNQEKNSHEEKKMGCPNKSNVGTARSKRETGCGDLPGALDQSKPLLQIS